MTDRSWAIRVRALLITAGAASALLLGAACAGDTEEGYGATTPSPAQTVYPLETATPLPTATPMAATPLPTAAPLPTATPMAATPLATATPLPTATPAPTATPMAATPIPTAPPLPAATPAPTATPVVEDAGGAGSREAGDYDGVEFEVGEGSEATFTVTEQLARLFLPNDAVMRTSALSGIIRLDGGPSTVEIDLQSLSSDQSFRDRYVQSRMFGDHPTGTFTVDAVALIPEGLAGGIEVTTEVTGTLSIRGETFPLEFDIEARDDGERLAVVGRATFTWDQLNIPVPTAPTVVSVEAEVRVEVLLIASPR